jgi:hypothetical protein
MAISLSMIKFLRPMGVGNRTTPDGHDISDKSEAMLSTYGLAPDPSELAVSGQAGSRARVREADISEVWWSIGIATSLGHHNFLILVRQRASGNERGKRACGLAQECRALWSAESAGQSASVRESRSASNCS